MGIAHLLRQTGVRALIVSPDAAMQRLAQQAKEELVKEGHDVTLVAMPRFANFFNDDTAEEVPMASSEPEDTALIIHSSGALFRLPG